MKKIIECKGFTAIEESDNEQKEIAKGDPYRFACFIFFLLTSIIGIIFLVIYNKTFFYLVPPSDFNNWPRWLFTLIFVLLGFSFIIYLSSQTHNPETNPYLVFASYFTKYLITVLILATIIFVIFSAINATSSYLYYFITAAIGISSGYVIDFAADIHSTLYRYLGEK